MTITLPVTTAKLKTPTPSTSKPLTVAEEEKEELKNEFCQTLKKEKEEQSFKREVQIMENEHKL